MVHIPVLQKEVLQYLDPKPNENFIDCTIGEGGHALAILEKTQPNGKLLGIDADEEQIENLKLKIGNFRNRIVLVCDNFANLQEIVRKEKLSNISGILFDLGMSSWHLEKSGRGFSFLKNEPLDMRYCQNAKCPEGEQVPYGAGKMQNAKLTAEKIVNYWSFQEIERILKEYGEEIFSEKIAREIVNARRIREIKNTFQLVEIIKKAVPSWYRHRKIHPATRTFQALRIAVNDELNNLKIALPQALKILKPEGKLAVISFHSLEDRIVKNFYGEQFSMGNLKILTKKPVGPGREEIIINRRSRSAKLRAAEKV